VPHPLKIAVHASRCLSTIAELLVVAELLVIIVINVFTSVSRTQPELHSLWAVYWSCAI